MTKKQLLTLINYIHLDENGKNKNNDSKKYQDSVNISFNPSSITITKQVLEYIDDSVVTTGKTVSINLASEGKLTEKSVSTSGFTSTATTLGEVISELSDNIRFSSETPINKARQILSCLVVFLQKEIIILIRFTQKMIIPFISASLYDTLTIYVTKELRK